MSSGDYTDEDDDQLTQEDMLIDRGVDDLAELMTQNRVRHVPVLDDGRLAGIVSIGDVVKTRMEELETEQQHLQDYITQGG